jgi:endonuclease III
MRLKARSDKIRKILRTIYPDVKTQLFHDTPFQLLVATILSAQCTDKQVNRVTRVMFNHLIYFGRETCVARKPKCPICPLRKLCPWPDKN